MTELRGISSDAMPLFDELIGAADASLHDDVMRTQHPTLAQRERVIDILSRAFTANLRRDDEPTARGKRIDDLLGAFLMAFPLDEDGLS